MGGDVRISKYMGGHLYMAVHAEMWMAICRWYESLPNPLSLSASEIRWFYDGLRPELHEATKPKPKPRTR